MIFPNGHTKLLGLIGTDISRSHSYTLHNTAIASMGLNAIYLPFQTQQGTLDDLLQMDHFLGANVTMPYKETMLPKMDVLTERAKKIGAINTIHKHNGKLIGDNTDAIGFLSAVKHRNIDWSNPIYMLGAGGAAKAVCYALDSIGVKHIRVWNRHPEKILVLDDLVSKVEYWDLQTNLPKKAIIIQCTPLGQHGEDPLAHHSLLPDQTLYDIIYTQTPLLQRIQAAGGVAIDGIGMLIHQAAYSFARWFNCEAPIDIMTHSLSNLLKTENQP